MSCTQRRGAAELKNSFALANTLGFLCGSASLRATHLSSSDFDLAGALHGAIFVMSKTQNPEEIYTQPELREKIKDELMQGDKGGKSGEWSARKSQMLAKEYEAQGGGYKNKEKTESQKSLDEWTDEDWQTSDGKVAIRGEHKTERYLPRAAWDKLTKAEKKEANLSKEKGAKAGEQTVEWTDAVKRVMKELDDEK